MSERFHLVLTTATPLTPSSSLPLQLFFPPPTDYDQYYASLAASAAPSTPSGEFSVLGDFEEDKKPNIEYLDALNEHNKRSRSVENEDDDAAERKQARVGDGNGGDADGWGLGQQQQQEQQAQENGEQQQEHLPMNGVESSGLNAQDVTLADEDPIVHGLYFPTLFPCYVQRALVFSGWQTNAVLASWRGAP